MSLLIEDMQFAIYFS